MMKQLNVLHINASSRYDGSLTRAVSTQLTEILTGQYELTVKQRDVASGLPFIDEQLMCWFWRYRSITLEYRQH